MTPEQHKQNVKVWFAAKGDSTLRINYPLTTSSVVFDVGGYQGKWAKTIADKYNCYVYVYEPVNSFHKTIVDTFKTNPKVKVFNAGLGPKDDKITISLDGDATSLLKDTIIKQTATIVSIKTACDPFTKIDLMKINIEGAEYDLLDYALDTGIIKKIVNLQVQFHAFDFIKNAEQRYEKIRQRLSATHMLTYHYPFVWENWKLT